MTMTISSAPTPEQLAFIRRQSEWGSSNPAPSTARGIKPDYQFLPSPIDYAAGIAGTPAEQVVAASRYLAANYGPGTSWDVFHQRARRDAAGEHVESDRSEDGRGDGSLDA
jgi:hypothetical protein